MPFRLFCFWTAMFVVGLGLLSPSSRSISITVLAVTLISLSLVGAVISKIHYGRVKQRADNERREAESLRACQAAWELANKYNGQRVTILNRQDAREYPLDWLVLIISFHDDKRERWEIPENSGLFKNLSLAVPGDNFVIELQGQKLNIEFTEPFYYLSAKPAA